MLLTNCAACAAPLQHLAKQCGRCKTRYCGPACQEQHWGAGHKDYCRRIKRGGGAEAYHADKKYKEAAALAVENCAEEAKGQTCYICRDERPDEGLVRMCACHTTEGFAHLSCLARQAQILVDEVEEDKLGDAALMSRWPRWYMCNLCGQFYHGAVRCALGWACWKTYVGRPENDRVRSMAMYQVASALYFDKQYGEALPLLRAHEAEIIRFKRCGDGRYIQSTRINIACCLTKLKRHDEAIKLARRLYYKAEELWGPSEENFIAASNTFALALGEGGEFGEARKLYGKLREGLGYDSEFTLRMHWMHAWTIYGDSSVSTTDLIQAFVLLERVIRAARRLMGKGNPFTRDVEKGMEIVRKKLCPGNVCAVCGRGGAKKICANCKGRVYCSVACQRRDWKDHKPTCDVQALAIATARASLDE